MSNYLPAFRGRLDADSPAAQEAVWAKWFQDLGPAILDMGHRVGRFTTVGSRGVVADGAGADPLTGYILLTADSLDSAAELAKGCPILQAGGKVEVGETFD
jgi:YCII-related domain